jgi:hypothetical protein
MVTLMLTHEQSPVALVQHYRAVSNRLNRNPRQTLRIVRPEPVKLSPQIVYAVPIGPTLSFYPPMTTDQEAVAVTSMFRVGRSKRILLDVCAEFNVNLNDLKSPCRERRIMQARHEAIYRLRENTTLSFVQIGKILDRDHSTCVDAYHKVRAAKMSAG